MQPRFAAPYRARRVTLGRQLRSVSLRYAWPDRVVGRPTARHDARRAAPRAAEDEPAADAAWARDARMARLEGILFIAREPLSTRRLAQLADLADGTEARTLIRRLNRYYDEGGAAFRAEEVAGGFQLLTRRKFSPWLRRLYGVAVEARLSAPAMETLAAVAYRQPVLRAQIEAIRGVDCGEILRQLMERDLVRLVGRSDDLGRPYLYGTTKRFLQLFGLRHLDDLPRAVALRRPAGPTAGLAGSMTALDESPAAGQADSRIVSTQGSQEE